MLFDLDGTLVDSADDLGYALNRLLIAHGKPVVSKQAYTKVASNGAIALLKCGFKDQWEHFSSEEQVHLKEQYLATYLESLWAKSRCFDGIENLLTKLNKRNIAWGIMTNKPSFLTTPLVSAHSLLKTAHVIVSGDTLAVAKPHPEPLLLCAQKLGMQPDECLYVGDDKRDIEAANAAGMAAGFVTWGYDVLASLEALSVDFVFDTPSQIENLYIVN